MGRSQQAGSEPVPKELQNLRAVIPKNFGGKGQVTPVHPGILRWKIYEPGPGNCIPQLWKLTGVSIVAQLPGSAAL